MANLSILRNVINSISPINDLDWELLEPHVKVDAIAKNDYFLQTGQCCNNIGFVLKGALRTCYIDPKGEDTSLHFQLENNFIVSYESYITRQPSLYNIQALEDSTILFFSRETLDSCFAKSHNWERFGRIIAEQMFITSRKQMQSLMYLSAEERYTILQNSNPHLIQRIPQYYIASYLGIKPQSLSRIKKNLKLETIVT